MTRLLIVDDDESMLESIIDWIDFKRPDAHYDSASNGLEALELLRNGQYNVVVCDWEMPELDGPGLFSRMVELGFNVPFILLTGNVEPFNIAKITALGIKLYMPKPFKLTELDLLIDQAISEVVS